MRLPHAVALSFLLTATTLVAGCQTRAQTLQAPQAPDDSEISLVASLASKPAPVADAVWSDVQRFYEQRANTPAWISSHAISEKGVKAMRVLDRAVEHGLRPQDYGNAAIAQLRDRVGRSDPGDAPLATRLGEFDIALTTALLALGRDVALGRSKPESVDKRWNGHRDSPDFPMALGSIAENNVERWLDDVRPRHPEYVALQKALADLRADQDLGGWALVPAGKFQLHAAQPDVRALRERLAASGELSSLAGASDSMEYDADVEAAVRAYQDTHGLKATGLADAGTIASMNVSLDARIRQVELNLDRWRWMPDDFGARHLIVNIPAFWLAAREQGTPVLTMRVVVGKRGKETPLFGADMTTAVFSPYWNIPVSIASAETAPAIAKDPSYLAKNDIEIRRVSKAGTSTVDPSTIDWRDKSAVRTLLLRQRPGSNNALGHVKFLLSNPFDVYLHDTPSESLFSREGRAFSHGCVRLDEPAALAKYVLRDQPEWDDSHIDAAMNAGTEKQVKLPVSIPVFVVYFTSWVDDAGRLHLVPDVYGYDAKQGARF